MRPHEISASRAARLFFVLLSLPLAGCATTEPQGFPCEDPGPVQIADKDTGFVFCTGGPVHRPKSQACPTKIPRASACTAPEDAQNACSSDADCNATPNGFCQIPFFDSHAGFIPGCACVYGCSTDAECGEGRICLCGDPVGRCVQADCTSDADCHGLFCVESAFDNDCNSTGMACQSELDECLIDADCTSGSQCSFKDDHRACLSTMCIP
jgi:hypothetical protein